MSAMKRAVIIGIGIATVGAAVAGAIIGPDWWAYRQFTKAVEHRVSAYETDGGAWPQLQDSCSLCHGEKGQPGNSQYASLAALSSAYLEAQLHAFADGSRRNPYMNPQAAALDDHTVKKLAAYYARQSPRQNEAVANDAALQHQGETAITSGACANCHGQEFMGSAQGPRLAGQGQGYLLDQLDAFKRGERQDPTQAMNGISRALSDEQIAAAAHYLAGLIPRAANPGNSSSTSGTQP